RSLDHGVWLVGIGTHAATSREVVALAEQFPVGVYAAVGIHPTHLTETVTESNGQVIAPELFAPEIYRALAQSPKVVALGEVGLDYYRLSTDLAEQRAVKQAQADVLRQFFELGRQTGKPLVCHLRDSRALSGDAYDNFLAILQAEQGGQPIQGVVHCFGGTLTQAKRCVELGLLIGITGIVTFKKADALREIVTALPLASLLTETDAPFLAPEPHRGQQNVPEWTRLVAAKIAEIKKISLETVAEQTVASAKQLFGID
ncbi:MAG: TatD family hydrolase, partial [Patescibacteria group bacterium]